MMFRNFLFSAIALSMFIFTSCQKDDDNDDMQGSIQLEITDAPVDDANVRAVFVTISDVKVDGQSLVGFNKTTIDLMTLQNGITSDLVKADLDANSYSSVTLVLDYESDESGNPLGCYLETLDGTKHTLISSDLDVQIDYDFDVRSNSTTNLVVDFDLRKSIKRSSGSGSQYSFVGNTEMNKALRIVAKNKTGTILGNCNDQVVNNAKVVVYAYHKNDLNVNNEIEGSAQSNLKFYNAVSSAVVDDDGSYELHFLEEGTYELYFAPYRRNMNGELVLNGTLIMDLLSDVNLSSINVAAAASTTVNINITGILPL